MSNYCASNSNIFDFFERFYLWFRKKINIFVSATLFLSIIAGAMPASANSEYLKPYKEKIFKYRKPLESKENGRFLKIPYDVKRDINQRDELPVRKVKGYYVSTRPKSKQQDLALSANGRKVTYFAVGALDGNARMTVIFLHGRDGSRHLGFDDDKFGGNFNRLKNLMFRNGGIYISADFADFKQAGMQDVRAIIEKYRRQTKGPLVVACGSMGSFLCWRLANNQRASRNIDGLVILGGFPDPNYLNSTRARGRAKPIPILMAHGSIDSVYNWKTTYNFYRSLRSRSPRYPVRYVLFDTGKHGTPVRMVDWRDTLNWIASKKR